MNIPSVEIKGGGKFAESRRLGELFLEYGADMGSEKIMNYGHDLISCGSQSHVYKKTFKNGKEVPVIVAYTCKSRACPPCNAIRLDGYRKRIDSIIEERGTENFIFLTVTNPKRVPIHEVRNSFDVMSKSLSDLFRTAPIKAHVSGGFRAFEGNSNSEGMINPHCHLLLESTGGDLSQNKNILKFITGKHFKKALEGYLKNNPNKTREKVLETTFRYLKKGRFSQLLWSAFLVSRGMGSVCNVQEVSKFKNPGKSTSEELCKYMTKTMKLDGARLPEFILAMKGKRLFSSWGSLKISSKDVEKKVFQDEEKSNESSELEYFGFLPDVIKSAIISGDTFSQKALGLAVKEKLVDVSFVGGLKYGVST